MLGHASGVQVVERGSDVLVVKLGTSWAYTFGFVSILVTVIFGINGLVQLVLFLGGGEGMPLLGVILLLVSVGGGAVVRAVVRHVRAQRTAPLSSLAVVAVFDRGHGQLRSGSGQLLAPLDQVVVGRAFQFTSSAPALRAKFPGGALLLAKGNVFAGGVEELEDALRAGGIRVGQ